MGWDTNKQCRWDFAVKNYIFLLPTFTSIIFFIFWIKIITLKPVKNVVMECPVWLRYLIVIVPFGFMYHSFMTIYVLESDDFISKFNHKQAGCIAKQPYKVLK